MSLYTIRGAGVSLGPAVRVVGDHLHARTSYIVQALTLFSYARKLHVDGEARVIELEVDRLWMSAPKQVIPFERVRYIDCAYKSRGTSWGWTDGGYGRTDQWERYLVSLVLGDPDERLTLFRFSGDGAVESGATGVLHGGAALIGSCGSQAEECGFFVSRLREILKVPVGSESEAVPDAMGVQHCCSVCGKPSTAKAPRCWHCGAAVHAMLAV